MTEAWVAPKVCFALFHLFISMDRWGYSGEELKLQLVKQVTDSITAFSTLSCPLLLLHSSLTVWELPTVVLWTTDFKTDFLSVLSNFSESLIICLNFKSYLKPIFFGMQVLPAPSSVIFCFSFLAYNRQRQLQINQVQDLAVHNFWTSCCSSVPNSATHDIKLLLG